MDKKRVEEALKIYTQEVSVKNIGECPCPKCCAIRTIISLAQLYLDGKIAEVPGEKEIEDKVFEIGVTNGYMTIEQSQRIAAALLREWGK